MLLLSQAMGFCRGTFKFFKGVPWAGVVLDEALNIKNPETTNRQKQPGLWKPITA
jgi:hypothetical protein